MTRLKKYINYVKEAFFNPLHVIALSVASVTVLTLMTVLPLIFGVSVANLLFLPLLLGGLEMLYLGAMSSSKRFVSAVNAKYHHEIQAYRKSSAIAEYYNSLSGPRQRRFEHFKEKLEEIQANYKKMHGNYPELVNNFLKKIYNLQLTYVRLLYMQDRFPRYLENQNPDVLQGQIDEIREKMKNDSEKLQGIKKKRIDLLKRRIKNYEKTKENGEIVSAQLQTIEEMVNYVKDQPVTLKSTDQEDLMIDNILFEAEQMEDTITDMESIISDDLMIADYGDMNDSSESYKPITE